MDDEAGAGATPPPLSFTAAPPLRLIHSRPSPISFIHSRPSPYSPLPSHSLLPLSARSKAATWTKAARKQRRSQERRESSRAAISHPSPPISHPSPTHPPPTHLPPQERRDSRERRDASLSRLPPPTQLIRRGDTSRKGKVDETARREKKLTFARAPKVSAI